MTTHLKARISRHRNDTNDSPESPEIDKCCQSENTTIKLSKHKADVPIDAKFIHAALAFAIGPPVPRPSSGDIAASTTQPHAR